MKSSQEFSDAEKCTMTLSSETLEGLQLTGNSITHAALIKI